MASDSEIEPVIDAKDLDTRFVREILEKARSETLPPCFQCGTCTASCPVSLATSTYSPRRIVRMALLGMRARVISQDSIWLCSTCYSCDERCPQDTSLHDIFVAIKNIATSAGYVHPILRRVAENVRENGCLYAIDEFVQSDRQQMGLPMIEADATQTKEIFRITGLDAAIGISEESPH